MFVNAISSCWNGWGYHKGRTRSTVHGKQVLNEGIPNNGNTARRNPPIAMSASIEKSTIKLRFRFKTWPPNKKDRSMLNYFCVNFLIQEFGIWEAHWGNTWVYLSTFYWKVCTYEAQILGSNSGNSGFRYSYLPLRCSLSEMLSIRQQFPLTSDGLLGSLHFQ